MRKRASGQGHAAHRYSGVFRAPQRIVQHADTNFYPDPHFLSFSLTGLEQLRRRAQARQAHAFAPGTRSNQISHVRTFLSFTVFFGLQDFPASTDRLLLFLEFLTLTYTSPKAVSNVLASVKLQNERAGFSLQNFVHVSLRLALRSLPFTMRTAVRQAPPFP